MSLTAFDPNSNLDDGNDTEDDGLALSGAKRPLDASASAGAETGLRGLSGTASADADGDEDEDEVKLKTSVGGGADGAATLLKVTKKRRTFNEAVLTNRDGLLRVYQDFPTACPFRGRGHEAADVKRLMSRYREWAFQLYPGLAFPDLLARCETLGTKAHVRAYCENMRERERCRYLVDVLGVPMEQIVIPTTSAAAVSDSENEAPTFSYDKDGGPDSPDAGGDAFFRPAAGAAAAALAAAEAELNDADWEAMFAAADDEVTPAPAPAAVAVEAEAEEQGVALEDSSESESEAELVLGGDDEPEAEAQSAAEQATQQQ